MSKDNQNENEPIGDLKFPVSKERPYPGRRKIFPIFLKGAILIAVGVMCIRCSYFIGAGYAEGEVSDYVKSMSKRSRTLFPVITFTTADGKQETFTGGITSNELNYTKGERVSVIYKKNNPGNAMIFSFMGFWFNWILVLGIVLFVWLGFTVVYYGYGD